MTNDGSEIIRTAGCLDDCCIQAKRDPCDPFTEFFYGTCCCNPLSQGCPAELTNECFECVQTNALIHDPTANCTGWEGQENFPWEDCMYAHRYECVQECCVEPESESLSQSTSMSPSQSTSESCPPLEIPDPPCENRNLYDELYHPETWDCVCQSGPWRCGVCNGASNTECECPCRQVVENQRVCDLYPHIPSAQCLFYQDCHPADEPEFIDYFKMYGLRSHSGWLKNNSFIDDRKKAPPLFGIVIGELVLDFSHKNSHVKMIVNWDSIHITGHAWGGYDLNNEGDNGIWDGWEALENIEPRVGPWKIDIWYTDGFQHDFSGVTGVPGEVSEINCGTITDPKDWNNTIEICAKADEEGYQLRLENTYHGETGISGFGWFHNMLCDDRCGLFLNQYHCPDADMHFVLESECGDVQSPSESASPSPPKEPCCMRMSPVRFPNETISGPEPGKRRFHDYGYYYNQESASESQSSSVSQTPTFENELLICDPTLSPFMIMPGAEYQLRDHFSIKKNVQFPPIDGSIPGFPGHIVHGGLRFGNLYITFTEEGTLLKMFYQPGQDSVLIKGHGWGRVLDEYGNYKEGFEPGTPLGPQFYHVEMEYVTGLHHVHGIKRIPRGAGGIPFLVRERDPETEKPIPVNHSKYNRGLLYPKDYHDLVIEFGAMDVPAPMFLVPDLIPNVQAVQFAIISNDDLELGTNGGFHGLGALWANCSNLEVDGSSSVSEQEEEEATVENLLAQVCVPQIVTIMMGQSQIEVPDGSGWLNFVIEGECPCDNPSPSPGFCPEHGVYHTHGDPAENSLSHSQSPLQSNTPHPDVNTTYPGQGFSRLKASTHIAVQMGETSLPPEKWNDPTIEYRKRQASGEDFFNPPTWQADTGYVVFTSDAFTTPYRFVTYNVAPAPEYELNGLRPGREWIFVQIQWNATNLPANFITKIGAGGVGDESPEKEQCGEGGGHNYTQCWIKFPPYGGVLYIGAATQPFYHLELDMELIGVNLTMVAENKIDFVRHVGMGIYAPYSPEDEFAQNSSEYNLGVFMLAGLGFAGMAAGVMFFRPKSASARMAASVRKGKGKATIQQV